MNFEEAQISLFSLLDSSYSSNRGFMRIYIDDPAPLVSIVSEKFLGSKKGTHWEDMGQLTWLKGERGGRPVG